MFRAGPEVLSCSNVVWTPAMVPECPWVVMCHGGVWVPSQVLLYPSVMCLSFVLLDSLSTKSCLSLLFFLLYTHPASSTFLSHPSHSFFLPFHFPFTFFTHSSSFFFPGNLFFVLSCFPLLNHPFLSYVFRHLELYCVFSLTTVIVAVIVKH